MDFYPWFHFLNLLPQHDVFFFLVGEEEDHLNVFIFHLPDLVDRLKDRSNATSPCDEKYSLFRHFLTVNHNHSSCLVAETSEWPVNVDSVSYL